MICWPFKKKTPNQSTKLEEEFQRFKADADEIKEMLRRMDRHNLSRVGEKEPKRATG